MAKGLTYKGVGVDNDKGNEFVERIRKNAAITMRDEVVTGLGGFAGAISIPVGYNEPILVSSADGVGTKLLLALYDFNYLMNVGQDLVAMVVNDILTTGAEPLFFLDYLATSNLDIHQGAAVMEGIGDALMETNMVLLGGETAQLPDMYNKEEFDLAGFGVGVVERSKLITGENITEGDYLVGVQSSGPHANGYTLIRKILKNKYGRKLKGLPKTRLDALMRPTILYHDAIMWAQEAAEVKGIANITGGGLIENVPRILHQRFRVIIDHSTWEVPELFRWLQEIGNINHTEMYRVFNMGVGLVIAFGSRRHADHAAAMIREQEGLEAWVIGYVVQDSGNGERVTIA